MVEITDNVFGDDDPDQTPIELIRDPTTDSYADSKEHNLRFLRLHLMQVQVSASRKMNYEY